MSGEFGSVITGLTDGLREGAVPLPDDQDLAEILSHYPEEKPVCFNYMQARLHVFCLCEIVRQMRDHNRGHLPSKQ